MNKRKNRPGLTRPRGRSVMAEGIYNNLHFMHAATSHVGNTVQAQTQSGAVFEGIFRTFSPQFQVILEVAHKVDNPNDENKICVDSVVDKLIIKPSDIVSIAAKDVDLDYAVRDTFQTDTAISKCNGSLRINSNRIEDRELEPWDPSFGGINGDADCFELDGNSIGWDVNEMFSKNEMVYGVHSTFDQSLTGYTMPIQKKDTQDYKEQEAEAEKIANEIESQTTYKERIELENGDEEQKYAAVDRNELPSPEPPIMSKTLPPGKYVPAINKRKNIGGKLVRNTPPPPQQQQQPSPSNNNNGTLGSSQGSIIKTNNNYQSMPMPQQQQNVALPQYVHGHIHSHIQIHSKPNYSQPPPNISVVTSKMNGESNNNNLNTNNSKSLPQRNNVRQYIPTVTPVVFTEPPPSLANQHYAQKQITAAMVTKQVMHVQQQQQSHQQQTHAHIVNQQQQIIGTTIVQQQEPSSPQPPSLVTVAPIHVVVQNQQQQQPPPQPQRQPRDEVQKLRNFQQDFKLAPTGPPQVQTTVITHQQQHQDVSPQQQQQQLMDTTPTNQKSQQQQQQTVTVQSAQQQQQQTEQQMTQNISGVLQQQQIQQQQVQTILVGSGGGGVSVQSVGVGGNGNSNSSTPPQQQQQIVNSNNNNNSLTTNTSSSIETTPSEKVGAKKFVLNPSAKPFTPRGPNNTSRPQTPQTPGPQTQVITQGQYQQAQHVAAAAAAAAAQTQMMSIPTYVMQPHQPFQAPPHPHGQQRFRKLAASSIQVAAATGQPLLAPAPLQQFMPYTQSPHPHHFQSQPFPQMVRMYHHESQQQQPQLQYLTPTPPSTTPSPGQPHQQYHPGQQPSPAGGGPQYAQAPPQAHQFQMMCPLLPGPQIIPQYFQNPQQPHHPQHIPVLMSQQHPSQ